MDDSCDFHQLSSNEGETNQVKWDWSGYKKAACFDNKEINILFAKLKIRINAFSKIAFLYTFVL